MRICVVIPSIEFTNEGGIIAKLPTNEDCSSIIQMMLMRNLLTFMKGDDIQLLCRYFVRVGGTKDSKDVSKKTYRNRNFYRKDISQTINQSIIFATRLFFLINNFDLLIIIIEIFCFLFV